MMNEVSLEVDTENSFFSLTDGTKLDRLDNKPRVYMWLMKTHDGQYLPTYIGETKNLKTRFKDHVYNLVVGQYWHIHSENADEYFEKIRQMDREFESWEKLIEENSQDIEANYGPEKMSRSLDLELIQQRLKFFEKQIVICFKFNGIDDASLRKQIESFLIVHFNNIIFKKYHFKISKNDKYKIVNFNLKGKKSNESIIGSISKYHSQDIKITNLKNVLDELNLYSEDFSFEAA